MKLGDLTSITELDKYAVVYDINGRIVARCDFKNDIPAFLMGVEVDSIHFRSDGNMTITLLYEDPTEPIDYIKDKIEKFKETVSDGDNMMSPEDVQNAVRDCIFEIHRRSGDIHMALTNGDDWDYLLDD